MSVKDPSWLAQHLRSGKRVLILAGALCDKLDVDGKSLLDYVVDISKKTGAPVAPTGNTVTGLRQRGMDVQKAWAIEMANFAHRDWHHPIMEKKPQIMVLVGYSPLLASNLASVVKGRGDRGVWETSTLRQRPTPFRTRTPTRPGGRNWTTWSRHWASCPGGHERQG